MERRRWLNQSQPQTLVIACFMLYINAAFSLLAVLSIGGVSPVVLVPIAAGVLGAYGIANERRWGYYLAVGVAFLPFVISAAFSKHHNPFAGADIFTLIFEIAVVALLLHPESRQYEKVWFK